MSVTRLPDTLPESSFREFLRFTLSLLESKEASKKEANWTLWNLIINLGDSKQDEEEREAGGSPYTSRRKVLMEHSENFINGQRAARTRAAREVWLGCLAALLQLDDS